MQVSCQIYSAATCASAGVRAGDRGLQSVQEAPGLVLAGMSVMRQWAGGHDKVESNVKTCSNPKSRVALESPVNEGPY